MRPPPVYLPARPPACLPRCRCRAQASGGGGRSLKAFQFVSVVSQFRRQLAELMSLLGQLEPHYVRCIKPNAASSPRLLDDAYTLHQLKCGGVMEAVRISVAGEARPPHHPHARQRASVARLHPLRAAAVTAAAAAALLALTCLRVVACRRVPLFCQAFRSAAPLRPSWTSSGSCTRQHVPRLPLATRRLLQQRAGSCWR